MEHVIRRTSYACVVPPALPDQLQEIVHTGQDVVHEDDRVEVLVLRVPQVVQRHERGVPHLGEVLDTVVERAARAHRRLDLHAQADRPAQGVVDAEERLRLVRRAVLVYRHIHVLVAEDGGHPEERREQVRDDVERVVQVDREEVLVVVCDAVARGRDVVALRAGAHAQSVEPRRPGGREMSDERGIPLRRLLFVEPLRTSCALLGVAR